MSVRSPDMWKSFLLNNYEAVKDEEDEEGKGKWTRALYCKEYLSSRVKEVLHQYLHDKADVDGFNKREEEPKLDVFDIQFAYNNHEVIQILKQRGNAITYLDWETVAECDKQLLEMI